MKCHIQDCPNCEDCAIIEITGKVPIDKYHCSYFKKSTKHKLTRQDPIDKEKTNDKD